MKKIKHYREQKGITQEELAEAIGMAQSEISAYESGTKSPRVNVLIAIADVLGVSAAELI